MSTQAEIQFAIDYVCALADTLYCNQCKNLPKKSHHCINCLSPFCYMCVRKFDSCPTCRTKYSDKSYLKYYELGDSNVDFIYSIASSLQKENVKLPLSLKKIVGQMLHSDKLEVGQSSKQDEFLANNDDQFKMHMENNPNLINKAGMDLIIDSDYDNIISAEENNSDPAWAPDESPKHTRKKIKRNKKPEKAQAKRTKNKLEAKVVYIEENDDQFDHRKEVVGKNLGSKDINVKESSVQNETDVNIEEDDLSRNSFAGFDKLLQECAEELSKFKKAEDSKIDVEEEELRSIKAKEKDSNQTVDDGSMGKLDPMNETENQSCRTYSRNKKSPAQHLAKAKEMFQTDLKIGRKNSFEVNRSGRTLRKNSLFNMSNKLTVNTKKSSSAKDKTSVKSKKPNENIVSDESMDKLESRAVKTKKEQTKRPRNQMNRNSNEIENLIRSKKLKLDDTENQDEENSIHDDLGKERKVGKASGGRGRKQLKLEGKENGFDSNNSEKKLSRGAMEKLLNDDKEINFGIRATRQRKDSKNESDVDISNEVQRKPTRASNKTLSESSADLDTKETSVAEAKRARTPREVTNTHKNNTNETKTFSTDLSDTSFKPKSLKRALSTTSEETPKGVNIPDSTPKSRKRRVGKPGEEISQSPEEYLTSTSQTPDQAPSEDPTDLDETPKVAVWKKEAVCKTPSVVMANPVMKTTPTVTKKTKPDPLYKRNMKGETPLHSACKRDVRTVQDLLSKQATPNVKDNAGWTPLHDAVSMGKDVVVRLLLESGALVNVPGLENDTPLHVAVRNENVPIAKLLIQYGADIQLRNLHGYKPLEYFDFIARTDWKEEVLSALKLPPLRPNSAPLPPANPILVIFSEGLDKDQTKLLAQFIKILDKERPIIVSKIPLPNVNTLIVAGTPDRLCNSSPNILRAILTGLTVIDISWISVCLEANRLLPSEEYEILGTKDHPEARPFLRSKENNEKMNPGLFSGLQVYLAPRPWPAASPVSYDEARDLVKCGGASLLTREPDPEAPQEALSSCVMWHVTAPDHPLYRLSQGILYCNQARPRRLYNMAHVKALSVDWFSACIQKFSIEGNTQQ